MCPPPGLRSQFLATGEDSDGGKVGRRVNRRARLGQQELQWRHCQDIVLPLGQIGEIGQFPKLCITYDMVKIRKSNSILGFLDQHLS